MYAHFSLSVLQLFKIYLYFEPTSETLSALKLRKFWTWAYGTQVFSFRFWIGVKLLDFSLFRFFLNSCWIFMGRDGPEWIRICTKWWVWSLKFSFEFEVAEWKHIFTARLQHVVKALNQKTRGCYHSKIMSMAVKPYVLLLHKMSNTVKDM